MKFTKYITLALILAIATPAMAKGHGKHKTTHKFNKGSMATGSPKARTVY